MSNLKDLVPPRELCKLIPAGEFEDSAFAWWQITPFEEWQVVVRSTLTTIPAPTLEEIMKALSVGFVLTDCVKNFRGWEVDCMVGIDNPSVFDEQSGATAALKLWLKLKGIEA